jgi:CPA1 family monovalent cation:H+ antiporter
MLFVLLGTQFRSVVHGGSGRLILDPLLVFGVLTVVRFLWMLTAVRDTLRDRIVLGWSGMRGALSLAAALSIPVAVAQRDQILYLTFTTILAGLVVLALPLPWLLDLLGFEPGGADEVQARERLHYLQEIAARRDELRRMEQHGEISHAAARRIELDLDREETLLNRR